MPSKSALRQAVCCLRFPSRDQQARRDAGQSKTFIMTDPACEAVLAELMVFLRDKYTPAQLRIAMATADKRTGDVAKTHAAVWAEIR